METKEVKTVEEARQLESEGFRLSGVSYILTREDQPSPQTKKELPSEMLFSLKLPTPISETIAPFSTFYLNRILPSIKAKHPSFDWQLVKNQDGLVSEIIFSNIEESQKKELESALTWTVKRVLEKERK